MSFHSKDRFNNDLPAGHDGDFEWDYLIPAFQQATGRRIQPMDLDAMVEINGHFLVFETKAEGKDVPAGQRQALMALWAHGAHMIVILWGKKDPMRCEIYYPGGAKSEIGGTTTKQRLLAICEDWARWANDRPARFQYKAP